MKRFISKSVYYYIFSVYNIAINKKAMGFWHSSCFAVYRILFWKEILNVI